jgi:hypothetical protein
VNLVAATDQAAQPGGVRSDSRRRETDSIGEEDRTAQGVDRRFAEDDPTRTSQTRPEIARVFVRAECQATPDSWARAAELGADGMFGSARDSQEHRVAPRVRVEFAGGDQRVQQVRGKAALPFEILPDAG